MGTPGRRNMNRSMSRAEDFGTPEKMPDPISPARSASPTYAATDSSRNHPATARGGDARRRAGGGGAARPRRAGAPPTPEDEVRKNFRSRRVGRTLQNNRSRSVNDGSSSSPRRNNERSWAATGPEPHPPDRREVRFYIDFSIFHWFFFGFPLKKTREIVRSSGGCTSRLPASATRCVSFVLTMMIFAFKYLNFAFQMMILWRPGDHVNMLISDIETRAKIMDFV